MTRSANPAGKPRDLLYTNCTPWSAASEEEWSEWLIKEHIPALVSSGAVAQATLYRETGFEMMPDFFHPLRYLILYRTDAKHLQTSEKYLHVCQQTGVDGGPVSEDESETRNYKLIQDYNPYGHDGNPAPHILTVEMNPEDGKDFEDWYRTELLPRISRLPGYKRSRRFELSDQRDNPSGASRYLAFHEVRNLDKAFQSEEQHEENLTAWKKKHIEASERTKTEQGGGFVRRGWELIHTEGDPVADMADEVRAKDPIPDSVEHQNCLATLCANTPFAHAKGNHLEDVVTISRLQDEEMKRVLEVYIVFV